MTTNVHRAWPVHALKTGVLLAVTALFTACPATTSNNTAANQSARTFQRGGDTNSGVFNDPGAGHSAAGGVSNFGGGLGRPAAMGGSR